MFEVKRFLKARIQWEIFNEYLFSPLQRGSDGPFCCEDVDRAIIVDDNDSIVGRMVSCQANDRNEIPGLFRVRAVADLQRAHEFLSPAVFDAP